MNTHCETTDLLVFSHLRWDFVFQRPQHLLSRHAKHRRVYYFEEPVFGMTDMPRLHLRETSEAVQVAVPYLPSNIKPEDIEAALRDLVDELIFEEDISTFAVWYNTVKALPFTRHLEPISTMFDKMDDHSLLNELSPEIMEYEKELLLRSDLVFTGGHSIYEANKHAHHNIHPFPSSIDYDHFSQGRHALVEPDDQVNIPHPRLGFYGVIDDRLNLELLKEMAALRPDFQFIMVGPVLRIDADNLPKAHNIHYLGKKDYHALPLYLSGWDCAIMPFALNDSTRFISPTITPEFLAAGKPVVSTSLNDVVSPYYDHKLVHVADTAEAFVQSCEKAMAEKADGTSWIERVDAFLEGNSWDETFIRMANLEKALPKKRRSEFHVERSMPTTISAGGVI